MGTTSYQRRGRAAMVAIWVVTILLALEFVLAGGGKFVGRPAEIWRREFLSWGLPAWSVFAVGAVEVGSALLLLVPRFAALGGALLAVTMVGATGVHALHSEWSRTVLTLILCALSLIVVRARGPGLRVRRTQTIAAAAALLLGLLPMHSVRARLDSAHVASETTGSALWGASCPRQGNAPTQLGS